jgi:hypothetical protein
MDFFLLEIFLQPASSTRTWEVAYRKSYAVFDLFVCLKMSFAFHSNTFDWEVCLFVRDTNCSLAYCFNRDRNHLHSHSPFAAWKGY